MHVATRRVLIVLLLCGLAIGILGGVGQAGLGRSNYLVGEAADERPGEPRLDEARRTLSQCFRLMTASMYLGGVVVLLAVVGLYLEEKNRRSVSADSNPQRGTV
jgi:hypothetical protein